MEASERNQRKPDDELREARIRLLEAKGALIAAQTKRLLDDQQPKANDNNPSIASSHAPEVRPRLKIEIKDFGKGPEVSSWHGQRPGSFFRTALNNDDLYRMVQTATREWLEETERARTP